MEKLEGDIRARILSESYNIPSLKLLMHGSVTINGYEITGYVRVHINFSQIHDLLVTFRDLISLLRLTCLIIPQQRAPPSIVPSYSSRIMVPSITQLCWGSGQTMIDEIFILKRMK